MPLKRTQIDKVNTMKLLESYSWNNSTYELFSNGKSFTTVVTDAERVRKNGTVSPAARYERKHRTLQAALNCKLRPSQALIDLISEGE